MARFRPPADLSAPPFPVAARLLAFAFLLIGTTAIFVNVVHPYPMDFVSYWSAAVLALQGNPTAAYDVEAHHAVQQAVVVSDGRMPFPYPPPFLLVVLPFGLLPYGVAAALWIAGGFALYLATVRRLFPASGWLPAAFPAVLVGAITGQNAFLTATLFAGGILLLPKRPFAAGVLLGLLIIKPQLGVLLPLAFIAGGAWRAFAGAALGVAGALLLGLLAFGSAAYAAMIELAPLYGTIARDGLVPWHKMASVYASLSALGISSAIALAIHIVVALAAAAAVWRVWRRSDDPLARAATLAAATLLASPYLYGYDMLILVIPLLWLLGQGENRALLALLWCAPLVSLLQDWGLPSGINPLPFVSIAVLFLVCRRALSGAGDRPRPVPSPA